MPHNVCLFVPRQLVNARSGTLIGYIDSNLANENYIIVVCGIFHSRSAFEKSTIFETLGTFVNVVTERSTDQRTLTTEANDENKFAFHLELDANEHLLQLVSAKFGSLDLTKNCTVVFMDISQLLSSEMYADKKYDLKEGKSTLHTIINSVVNFKSANLEDSELITDFTKPPGARITRLFPFHYVCKAIQWVVCLAFSLLQTLTNWKFVLKTKDYYQKILTRSSLGSHLVRRTKQLRSIAEQDGSQSTLKLGNVQISVIVDIALGLLVGSILSSEMTNHYINLLDTFIFCTQFILTNLSDLLLWLMGVPAGFKLNHQLNNALGRFFLYHIYLWQTYISLIHPLLDFMINCIVGLGCLGITAQICLINDIISFATLHVYCFYIYAARLYYLQTTAVSSLWRLFRGKKWNPLRDRVDSSLFETDQLFIGTILFTILIFLFPTTLLYYFVFTLLRCVVLVITGTLNRIVWLYSTMPIYSFALLILGPQKLSNDVVFTIHRSCNDVLYVNMEPVRASLSAIVQSTSLHYCDPMTLRTKEIIGSILVGQLIYPMQ